MYRYIIVILSVLILFLCIQTNYFLTNNNSKNLFQNKKVIHIWYKERYDNAIKFMYNPIILSISKIITHYNDNIIFDYKSQYEIEDYDFNQIKEGNTLIWVGFGYQPDFSSLKTRGVYTIYFNTEPFLLGSNSHELWTYSKYLFNNYEKNNDQIIKFIPIICEENVPYVPYNLNNNIKLIFLGNIDARKGKIDILLKNTLIKNNFESYNNLWNDNDYNNFMNNKSNIFLCLSAHTNNILPTLRINKLLSHKCIIISEYTNPIDEAYYKDMVYFCNLDEIPNIYQELLNKTNIELDQISNEIYKKFYDKFYYKNAVKLITEK
jgi:hypothetical protein